MSPIQRTYRISHRPLELLSDMNMALPTLHLKLQVPSRSSVLSTYFPQWFPAAKEECEGQREHILEMDGICQPKQSQRFFTRKFAIDVK